MWIYFLIVCLTEYCWLFHWSYIFANGKQLCSLVHAHQLHKYVRIANSCYVFTNESQHKKISLAEACSNIFSGFLKRISPTEKLFAVFWFKHSLLKSALSDSQCISLASITGSEPNTVKSTHSYICIVVKNCTSQKINGEFREYMLRLRLYMPFHTHNKRAARRLFDYLQFTTSIPSVKENSVSTPPNSYCNFRCIRPGKRVVIKEWRRRLMMMMLLSLKIVIIILMIMTPPAFRGITVGCHYHRNTNFITQLQVSLY